CLVLATLGLPYRWFGYILEKMLLGLDNLTRYFAEYSFAQVRDLNPSLAQIICYYLIITFVVAFIYKKRFWTLAAGLCVILALQGFIGYCDYQKNHRHEILVYNQLGETILECSDSGKSKIYGKDKQYVWVEGKRVILLSEDIRHTQTRIPLKGDIIILSKGFKGNITDLQKLYRFKSLVLSTNMSRYYADRIESDCTTQNIYCHNVGKQGAFIYPLSN
ncbi:MAG: hypothetical protein Q8909_15585, partial [Bacteroidota bacterium]|nr:hypothetical protein [Bacteroidota bacterium]